MSNDALKRELKFEISAQINQSSLDTSRLLE